MFSSTNKHANITQMTFSANKQKQANITDTQAKSFEQGKASAFSTAC